MSGQDLFAYLAIIKKRLWLIVLLVAVTVGTILAVFLTAKPTYSASVRFLVTAPPSGDVSVYGGFRQPTAREEMASARANFAEILRGGPIAYQTVEELGINMRGSELMERTEVETLLTSEFVHLTVTADTAEEAQLLANGLMENALRYYSDLRARPTMDSLSFISAQLDDAQQELETAQSQLLQFQIENHMGDLVSEIQSLQTLIRSLSLQRDQAMAEASQAGAETDKMSTVAAYDRIIAERQIELQQLLHLSAEYTVLKSAVSRAQSLYFLLLDKQTEAKLKENEVRNVGFVQVVEPARKPSSPNTPFNAKVIIVGAVASLIVGVLLAFLLEYVEGLHVSVPSEEEPKQTFNQGQPSQADPYFAGKVDDPYSVRGAAS